MPAAGAEAVQPTGLARPAPANRPLALSAEAVSFRDLGMSEDGCPGVTGWDRRHRGPTGAHRRQPAQIAVALEDLPRAPGTVARSNDARGVPAPLPDNGEKAWFDSQASLIPRHCLFPDSNAMRSLRRGAAPSRR
ncbi:MAG: hypothetical protein QOH66_2497 [Actinomycetota bacterium]|jgi:hypothetical protein|nr:hypothetical protein [Actinomycetota bacterium]